MGQSYIFWPVLGLFRYPSRFLVFIHICITIPASHILISGLRDDDVYALTPFVLLSISLPCPYLYLNLSVSGSSISLHFRKHYLVDCI